MRKLLLVLALVPLPVFAQTLATVDGTPITAAQVLAANPAAAQNAEVRQQTLNILMDRALLAAQAKKSGLDHESAVAAAIAVQTQAVYANAAAQRYFQQHPISHEAIQKAYDKAVAALPARQYRLREILVPSRPEAEKILIALGQGQSFSQLAAQYPQSPNSTLGGELGWVNGNAIAAPILKELDATKIGEVVGPISVPEGWVVIQMLGQRPTPKLTLAQAQGQIEEELQQQALNAYIQKLRQSAHIMLTAAATSAQEKQHAH
jgi:peptidyl-prolyl cis-trans isomerase C